MKEKLKTKEERCKGNQRKGEKVADEHNESRWNRLK